MRTAKSGQRKSSSNNSFQLVPKPKAIHRKKALIYFKSTSRHCWFDLLYPSSRVLSLSPSVKFCTVPSTACQEIFTTFVSKSILFFDESCRSWHFLKVPIHGYSIFFNWVEFWSVWDFTFFGKMQYNFYIVFCIQTQAFSAKNRGQKSIQINTQYLSFWIRGASHFSLHFP